MQITIDGREFELEARKVERDIRPIGDWIKAKVSQVSLSAKRMIQIRMPKDTGRATVSWGNVPAPPPAFPDEGIWEVKDNGFTIVQGSKVPYIGALNDGWSAQAPAGFIDAEEESAADTLEKEIGETLLQGWGT